MLLALSLIATHAVLVAASGRLPDSVAPLVAATVFLPLWLLSAIGLPVYGRPEAGGWSAPNLFGWCMLVLLWSLIWTAIAFLLVEPKLKQ